HPNNAFNLAPVYVVCLFGALRVAVHQGAPRVRSTLKAILVPVLGALMIGVFGYIRGIATYVENPPANVSAVQTLFWKDESLASFMRSSGIAAGAHVVLADHLFSSQLPPQDA